MSAIPARHNASPRSRRVRRGLSAASPRKATGSRAIWIEEDEEVPEEVEANSSRLQDEVDRLKRMSQGALCRERDSTHASQLIQFSYASIFKETSSG